MTAIDTPTLMISSTSFVPKPLALNLSGADTDPDWLEKFKVALPTDAKAVLESCAIQEPLVFITRRNSGIPSGMGRLFNRKGGTDNGTVMFEDGPGLGDEIRSHIEGSWDYMNYADGGEEWIGEGTPSCEVFTFYAASPLHAYLRVLVSIADSGDWEQVQGLMSTVTPFDDEDYAINPGYVEEMRKLNFSTSALFIHLGDDEKIYVATTKITDLVAESLQWVVGSVLETTAAAT